MDGRETVIPSAGVDVCEGFGDGVSVRLDDDDGRSGDCPSLCGRCGREGFGGQYRVVTGGNDGRWAGLELLDVGEL